MAGVYLVFLRIEVGIGAGTVFRFATNATFDASGKFEILVFAGGVGVEQILELIE
jgi:hypothetical protein